MEYKVVEENNLSSLNRIVAEMIEKGWKPVGSHQVAEVYTQLWYNGIQHKDTTHTLSYSQTMIKE